MLHIFLKSDVLSRFRDQFAQLDFQEGGLSWEKRLILNGIPDLVKKALTSELPLSHAKIKLKI